MLRISTFSTVIATASNRPDLHHWLAALLLAFITMSGLSYINFLPALVSALAGDIGFSEVQAGQIVALNGYGALCGTSLAIFLVRHIRFRPVLIAALLLLASMDIATLWLDDFLLLLGWRFLAGLAGGLALGLGVALLARHPYPDRAFGALLFVQFSVGSLVIYLLPTLEAMLSAHAVFYVMASFAVLSLVLVCLLPAGRLQAAPDQVPGISPSNQHGRAVITVLLLLAAMLVYQIAASAIWAYAALIGTAAGVHHESVSTTIAVTGMLGLLGALLPMMLGNSYGRLPWLIAGCVFSISAAILLTYPRQGPSYPLALALLFFSWPAVQSFLLAATSALDSSGRLATLVALVSSVGLATGPLLASALIADSHFGLMLQIGASLFVVSLLLLYKPILWSGQHAKEA
ncbi:MFS transporter [Alkalimonas sp. MEB108]|uniref:MFS transporter n=1 Tax=Alkalimonas cellulosilytica TaxID=3058395 RepID=A0ABU7J4B5_9GAMM|nr:MFS transporter [Alkalimonas sp. MEB108]MEE2001344.1 MFS transporter [Alkalimonas sp. MEB108]